MTASSPTLVRTIGRWALAGLVLNGILGSAVYGLPSVIGRDLGAGAPIAWVFAAVLIGVIVACFAEVSSRFTGAGGPYLYVNATYGRYAGIQTGWLAYLARLTASAGNANLFVIYLGELWPGATGRIAGILVVAALVGGLAVVNYRGVKHGAGVSSGFAAVKLLSLAVFIAIGLAWWAGHGAVEAEPAPRDAGPWLGSLLALVFAYGGFEAALMPLAEAKDPRRDAPFALGAALLGVAVVYALVQILVTATLPAPGETERPLAAAARVYIGASGAGFMAVCAMLSTFGYLAGGMVNVPRLTFAMAEQGDLPKPFGAVHRVFRTPFLSILLYAVLVFLLAASGGFVQNLRISAASRLITYGLVCAAVIVLRRRDGTASAAPPALFRLPGGPVFAVLGVLGMAVVATQMTAGEAVILAVVVALATLHWWQVGRGF